MIIQGTLLARNTLLNIIGHGLTIVAALCAIPFVIEGVGKERFGVLTLAWIIFAHSTVFDLGLSRAVTKFAAQALGKREQGTLPQIVWTAILVQMVFGLLGTVLLAVATSLLVEKFLNIPTDLRGEARLCFYLLALSIPAVLVSASFRGVLEAAQRFDLINAVRVPFSIVNLLLPLGGVFLGFRLPGIVALLIVSRGVETVVNYCLSIWVFPVLRGRICFCREKLKDLASFGGWIAISSILAPFLLYMDRFLIGSLITMSAVTFYTTPFELISRLSFIPASMVMTLFPAFSFVDKTDKATLRHIYLRALKYSFLLMVPLLLILMAFSRDILLLWLGVDFARESTLVLQILLFGTLLGVSAPISGSLLYGLGHPDIIPKLYLLYLPWNIVFTWYFVDNMGVTGAALAFTVRIFLEAAVFFGITARFIELPCDFLSQRRLWSAIAILLGFALCLWLLTSTIAILTLKIGGAILAVSLLAIMVWRYIFDEGERGLALTAAKKLWLIQK